MTLPKTRLKTVKRFVEPANALPEPSESEFYLCAY